MFFTSKVALVESSLASENVRLENFLSILDFNERRKDYNMWRELTQELKLTARYPLEVEFADRVGEDQIKVLEMELGTELPKDLKSLLLESNGISDEYGLGIIWSIEEISQYNREMRTLPHYVEYYMPFNDMLFFADAGNGDRFAFPIVHGKVKEETIFAWNHENDSRWEVAFSLRSYLDRLFNGKIKL